MPIKHLRSKRLVWNFKRNNISKGVHVENIVQSMTCVYSNIYYNIPAYFKYTNKKKYRFLVEIPIYFVFSNKFKLQIIFPLINYEIICNVSRFSRISLTFELLKKNNDNNNYV